MTTTTTMMGADDNATRMNRKITHRDNIIIIAIEKRKTSESEIVHRDTTSSKGLLCVLLNMR